MENAFFTIIGAFLGYLGGIIKDAINHKHELTKIRFIKLHETQACVIAELYSRIVQVNEKSMAYFSPVGTMQPDEKLPLADKLGDAMVELLKFYRPNEIYLSDSTCDLINKLVNSVKDAAGTYSIYLIAPKTAMGVDEKKQAARDKMDAWKNGYTSLKDSGEISNMLKELKADLRNLIGVK